jgi:hypothetical protein
MCSFWTPTLFILIFLPLHNEPVIRISRLNVSAPPVGDRYVVAGIAVFARKALSANQGGSSDFERILKSSIKLK